jgi:GT2 family glycosyltransferase
MRHTADLPDFRIEYAVIDDASPEWASVDWTTWPNPDCPKVRFETHGGLTRSWNAGLLLASETSAQFTVCTNSDVLFARGWLRPLLGALDEGFDLVGPVTNAPGHAYWQHVLPFCRPYEPSLDDVEDHIDQVGTAITEKSVGPITAPINGFFMMARTSTWWKYAFDQRNVFDPAFPLVHNEVELQKRWLAAGCRIGFVPQSYIFHYRSVSRPDGLNRKSGRGAYRPPNFIA